MKLFERDIIFIERYVENYIHRGNTASVGGIKGWLLTMDSAILWTPRFVLNEAGIRVPILKCYGHIDPEGRFTHKVLISNDYIPPHVGGCIIIC